MRRQDAGWWLLILPAFLLMTAFYVAPIAQVLAISFTEPSPGLGNYERLFTSESVQRVILTTLRICVITTSLALLLGYILAYKIALASEVTRRWWILTVLVPLWISVLVRAFAWVTLLRRQGLVNNALMEAASSANRCNSSGTNSALSSAWSTTWCPMPCCRCWPACGRLIRDCSPPRAASARPA
jgi:ABC-type spermidine/putrescine transport system permease subunit I